MGKFLLYAYSVFCIKLLTRLRKHHKEAAKLLEDSGPLDKAQKSRPKDKKATNKIKNLNKTNDLSFLDQFEHLAISDPGSGQRLKSGRQVRLNNRKKLAKINQEPSKSDSNVDREPEPGDQDVQAPEIVSPLQSAAQFLAMSSAGLVSAAVMVYFLNLPCL